MDWLPRRARKRIFFTPFSPFSAQNFFLAKLPMPLFKVVYQASHIPKIRKIYGLVAKKCSKMHIFHTFSPFLANKFLFLQKIRLRQFLGTIKSYLDTKNQKKTMEPFERNLYGRTDVRVQISSPS